MKRISFVFGLLTTLFLPAQQNNYIQFTTNDGLPSNHVYKTIIDHKGFLWIATEAGIARYDGKYFQVFTTQDGLPDNEVIELDIEENGTLWANSLKYAPAYFDDKLNRFVSVEKNNKAIVESAGVTAMQLFVMADSGVMYKNEKGSFIFYNKKLNNQSSYLNKQPSNIKGKDDGYIDGVIDGIKNNIQWFYDRYYFNKKAKQYFFYINNQNGKKVYVQPKASMSTNEFTRYKIFKNSLYVANTKQGICYKVSNFKTNPNGFTIDSINIKEPFFQFKIDDNYIYFTTNSAKVLIYNKKSLLLENSIQGNYLPNNGFKDNNGNIWISTVDKGLFLYSSIKIHKVDFPINFNQTYFLSITKKAGSIYAGNYYGTIIEKNAHTFNTKEIIKRKPARIRKIILHNNNIYLISEQGLFLNYSHEIRQENDMELSGKTALLYNDTLLIVGAVGGMVHINTQTQKPTGNFRYKKVMKMAKTTNGLVYFISNQGLYTYNVYTHAYQSLNHIHPLLSGRLTDVTITPDGCIWLATAADGIIVLKNNKVIKIITTKDGLIDFNTKCILAVNNNQIWLGTTSGISKINYAIQANNISYTVQNITQKDGLASNEVNEIILDNDTVYLATSNGINKMSVSYSAIKSNMPVYLTQIKINERDTGVYNNYNLNKNQRSVFLQFAAIDLKGHFKQFKYSLNHSKNWIPLKENTLSLQLNHGEQVLQIKAIDVNGFESNKILKLHFNIALPYWKEPLFWVIIFLIIQGTAFVLIFKFYKRKKEAKLKTELANIQTASLEQQAFTSLMNPHFMFNALNSIQHYINKQDRLNANRYLTDFALLIRKNFEGAQESFITLEQEIESTKIYLRLEQMRFTKQFAYKINIDETIDTDEWMIPSMMLQPLIENALLHGLMHSKISGELIINFKEQHQNLLIEIIDNGIGFENSALQKANHIHKSKGMSLITKRIKALNHFVTQPIEISFQKITNHAANPGNKTTLVIPADLYHNWLKAQKA